MHLGFNQHWINVACDWSGSIFTTINYEHNMHNTKSMFMRTIWCLLLQETPPYSAKKTWESRGTGKTRCSRIWMPRTQWKFMSQGIKFWFIRKKACSTCSTLALASIDKPAIMQLVSCLQERIFVSLSQAYNVECIMSLCHEFQNAVSRNCWNVLQQTHSWFVFSVLKIGTWTDYFGKYKRHTVRPPGSQRKTNGDRNCTDYSRLGLQRNV